MLASAFLIQLAAAHSLSMITHEKLAVALPEQLEAASEIRAKPEAASEPKPMKEQAVDKDMHVMLTAAVSKQPEGPEVASTDPDELEAGITEKVESGNMTKDEAAELLAFGLEAQIELLKKFLHTGLAYITLGVSVSLAVWTGLWLCCCLGRKRSVVEVSKEDLTGEFAPVRLGNCCSSCANFFEACCCNVCQWAETAGKIRWLGCGLPFWIIMVYIIAVLEPFTLGGSLVIFGFMRCCMRMNIRETKNQGEPTCIMDFCVHAWCGPCATHQEAEFVEDYESVHGIEKVQSAPA
jgi:Cys-rich protein (TIGR01571 family)